MLKYLWREEKGQGLVEMALVLPLLILLLFGVVEMGRIGYAYISVSNAARAGAREASVGGNSTDITNAIYNAAPSLTQTNMTITISPDEIYRHSGNQVKVEVKYPVNLIVPIIEGIIPDPVVVGAQLTMRLE